jgi:DNA-binding NarL/FixJ family response regulator
MDGESGPIGARYISADASASRVTGGGCLQLTSVRILLVDDFAPWRQIVSSMLSVNSELQIVGEASDGPEAIEKADGLKPDLILLDIGLPTLNGIEAARQIRKLVPESKIIFLSQESSPEIIEEAMNVGVSGYVVKTMAGSDLLATLDSVFNTSSPPTVTIAKAIKPFGGRGEMDLHIADEKLQEGVLVVTGAGTFKSVAALRLLKQICHTAREKHVNKILVNTLALDGTVSELNRYQVAVELTTYLQQRGWKYWLAIVGKSPTVDGFGVRVAQNRGLSAEYFSTEQEALNWLKRWPDLVVEGQREVCPL